MEKPILITATSLDGRPYGPVSRHLEAKGFPVVVYRTDKVLADEEQLCIDITNDGELTISYDNQLISPAKIAWETRPRN